MGQEPVQLSSSKAGWGSYPPSLPTADILEVKGKYSLSLWSYS